MRSPSLPLGSLFGVELRLHVFMLAGLTMLLLYASLAGVPLRRGFALWLLLLAAIAARETGRALTSAYFGLDLQRLILLPTGGVAGYGEEKKINPRHERILALSGPVSNFIAALTMALLAFAVTSRVNLFQRPAMSPSHLLRGAIWMQVLLGGLHLLPASPMDAGVLLRRQFVRVRGAARGERAAAGLGRAAGWALVLLGCASQEIVVILMGGTVLLSAQGESHSLMAQTAAKTLTVRDVMLTEWTSLSASDTLEDAVRRSTHSLQEAFPVVRGPLIVGGVARQTLLSALRSEGNSYVQSVMSKGIQVAAPEDGLMDTLQRAARSADGGTTVVPVVEHGRVIGMVTPRNLAHSMTALGKSYRLLEREKRSGGRRGPDVD